MNQTIGVNITPQSFQPTLHYSQGDVGRVFVVNVTDYDIPTGATVTCVATKPSGMGFTVNGTVSGNSVTFTSTAEMTDEWGRFPAEIRIASGNTLLGTSNFLMIGEKDPHPASTIDGTQEELIPQLTLLVNRVEAAAESVHDLTVSAITLTAGSDATATYDSTNNSIAFGIPRGADGDVTRSEFNDLKNGLSDETSARILLAGRVTTAESDIDTLETHKVAQPLDGNNQPTNGTSGQSLRTKGNGATEWADVGLPTDAQTAQAVGDWLDDHPEVTTTVQDNSLTTAKYQDGSISEAKLDVALRDKFNLSTLINFENICRLPYRRSDDAGMQGGVCTKDGVFYQYSNANNELLKFNLATGVTINSNTLSLGHCNSMAFIEDENKLLCYATFGEDDLPYNRLTVIDGDTLEVLSQIDLDLPSSLSLGTNPTQEYGYMCSYDNDKAQLYVAGQRFIKQSVESYIFKYDYTNGGFVFNEYGILPDSLATSASDMCFYDGNNYILTSEKPQIVVLDEEYNVANAISVDRIVSSLSYATEFESISIKDGEIIVGYMASCFKNSYGEGSYAYAKASLYNSVAVASKTTPEFSKQITLYVDNSNNNYDRDGSQSNPFNNIYEALNCAYNFTAITIIDTSSNEDSFVLAVEEGQHITFNGQNSAISYGILMDGGYLYAIRCGHSAFTIDNADYTVRIENGAECNISVWNKTGGADVTLDDGTVWLNNGAKLGIYGSMLTNIDALNIAPSCSVIQITDFAPNNTGLIRSDSPANIRTKKMKGFHMTLNGSPSGYFIPIQCELLLRVTINSKQYNLQGAVMGTPITWDVDGKRIAMSLARTNQWGKITMGVDSGVTINSFEVWI